MLSFYMSNHLENIVANVLDFVNKHIDESVDYQEKYQDVKTAINNVKTAIDNVKIQIANVKTNKAYLQAPAANGSVSVTTPKGVTATLSDNTSNITLQINDTSDSQTSSTETTASATRPTPYETTDPETTASATRPTPYETTDPETTASAETTETDALKQYRTSLDQLRNARRSLLEKLHALLKSRPRHDDYQSLFKIILEAISYLIPQTDEYLIAPASETELSSDFTLAAFTPTTDNIQKYIDIIKTIASVLQTVTDRAENLFKEKLMLQRQLEINQFDIFMFQIKTLLNIVSKIIDMLK
jgi:hypothetical protein